MLNRLPTARQIKMRIDSSGVETTSLKLSLQSGPLTARVSEIGDRIKKEKPDGPSLKTLAGFSTQHLSKISSESQRGLLFRVLSPKD